MLFILYRYSRIETQPKLRTGTDWNTHKNTEIQILLRSGDFSVDISIVRVYSTIRVPVIFDLIFNVRFLKLFLNRFTVTLRIKIIVIFSPLACRIFCSYFLVFGTGIDIFEYVSPIVFRERIRYDLRSIGFKALPPTFSPLRRFTSEPEIIEINFNRRLSVLELASKGEANHGVLTIYLRPKFSGSTTDSLLSNMVADPCYQY